MPGKPILLAAALLLAAACLTWSNSFSGPFILDDPPAITENATIRDLSAFRTVLSPPRDGQTVSGRPLVNLSLAVNWAVSRDRVWSYHALNLVIHVCAGLALFGVIRLTVLQPRLRVRFGANALPLALTVAALWLVHPLQTESVTYIVQRAESLAGLFCLLTLYGFIRGTTSEAPARRHACWLVLSVFACLCGMASKEVMVGAPLLVLLYDRTFVAGTFFSALRVRKVFYAALAATWLLLVWLVATTGTRGATAGFGLGISAWAYLLTQCHALVHYLRLAAWPHPQVLDYGFLTEPSALAVLPQAALLLTLLAATIFALCKNLPAGFLGAWFFILLAPSSSVVPVATQTMAEHRMYLPLAAVVVAAALALHTLAGRRSFFVFATAALAFGTLTFRRNHDYRSALTIWQDTVAKRPQNARAHQELGVALFAAGRLDEAIASYQIALQLQPDYPKAQHNLASALADAHRWPEAHERYVRCLRSLPNLPEAHYGLGNVLVALQRLPEAADRYEEALRLRPEFFQAHNNLANVLSSLGREPESIAHYEAALRLNPLYPDGHINLANVLARLGRHVEAIPHYQAALHAAPAHAGAHGNLGVVLLRAGRRDEGLRHLAEAVRLDPADPSARANLAAARAQ